MARGRIQFLSKDEIERIHAISLRILENIGVAVHSPSTADMLVGAGAHRSKDGKRVLFPQELVKSALSSVPRSFVLYARERKWDIGIPNNDKMFVANGGEAAFVRDLLTGESRYPTTDDVRDFATLVNQMSQIDFCWMMVGALDQPAHLQNLVEMKTCLEFTSKHVQVMCSSGQEATNMVKLASLITGGEKELDKRPIFSAVQCPISPLILEKGLVEAQVEFAKAGVPVVSMVAAVAGLTSPVTLSGTITQVNAENLASLVVSQTSRKGAPWVYSCDSSPGDLRTGSMDYGALETHLIRAGSGQMGRYYGVPTMVGALGIEATSLSLSSVREGIPYMAVQSLVDSDLAAGFGGIDQASAASFEQLLIDAWVWEIASGFSRSFDADEAAISYDTILEAGLEGGYLNKRHTLSRFKREFLATTYPDAVFSGRPETGERGALAKKASEEARKMLARPKVPVITHDESDAMSRFLTKLR